MKKLILFIMILFVQVSFAQKFAIKDSTNTAMNTLRDYARRLTAIDSKITDFITLQNTVNALVQTVVNQGELITSLQDSINQHRLEINAIKGGGVIAVPDPNEPTNLSATAISVSQINLDWDAPVAGTTPDSFRVYRSTSNSGAPLYNWIASVPVGTTAYNNTGLNSSTTYYYVVRSLVVGSTYIESNNSNVANATTLDPEPPPSGGIDYYVSASATGSGNGSSGSPFTLAQAISLSDTVTNKTFSLGIGLYSISSSISFKGDGNVFIGTLNASDEKSSRDCDGTNSTCIKIVAGSQAQVSLMEGATLRKMAIVQTEARYLFQGYNDSVLDSVALKYSIETNSSSNHLIQINNGADKFRISNCWIYDAPRCAIWVRWTTNAPDSVIIENTWFGDCDGHNPIQYMPSTETYYCDYTNGVANPSPAPTCQYPIIRNCTFENNPYSDGVVWRNCDNIYFYGNLIKNSGKICIDQYPAPPSLFDTCTTAYIVYNTWIASSAGIGAFGNMNSNGVVFKNNVLYNSSTWYSGLVLRQDVYDRTTLMQGRIDLRHNYDYNYYYNATDASASLWYVLWSSGTALTSQTYTWATWRSTLGFDAHSSATTIPPFVDLNGGDYNVTTSAFSGNTTGIPSQILNAKTHDGSVRQSNSIGFNNKK